MSSSGRQATNRPSRQARQSKGEFTSVAQANGGIENMINWAGKDQDTLALIKYIADDYFSEAKGNFDAKYPRLGLLTTEIKNNQVNSTFWMRNGSFLRLKNVEMGYRIPYGRIYISASNLLTFSPFDLWDPELSGWNSYPLQRTVNVGFQLNL